MKKKTVRITWAVIGGVVVLAVLYAFFYHRYHDKAFILVYHRIEPYQGGHKSLYVSPGYFDFQMKFLAWQGYTSVGLDELRIMVLKKRILPKVFCITFDDGYKNTYQYAYPVLKKYGLKATVFVTTAAIGRKMAYRYMPEAEHMSENNLQEIRDVFKIGSHSVHHKDMSMLSQAEIAEELTASKTTLERITQQEITDFCYPFGKYFNDYSVLLMSCGFKTACTTQTGFVDVHTTNAFLLPRIEWKQPASMNIRDLIKNLAFFAKILLGI